MTGTPQRPLEFTIRYEDRETYLYAFVTGPHDSLPVSRAFWTELAAEVRRRGRDSLLVEEDFIDPISIIEIYDLVETILALDWERCQVAFVDRQQSHRDINEFGELVARNRGFVGRVFATVEQAHAWLTRA